VFLVTGVEEGEMEKIMEIFYKLKRKVSRTYTTDRKDRFLRVAKVMGFPESIIEHELQHLDVAEELGHQPTKYTLTKGILGNCHCSLNFSRSVPREDIAKIASAPGFDMSREDSRTLFKANMGL